MATLDETLNLKCLPTGYYTIYLLSLDACDYCTIPIRYSTETENTDEDDNNNLDKEENNNETEENINNKLQIAINSIDQWIL
ncbi:hypothetical protein F8M41_003328 [Gigaspora margarita]|uniref:Uncharacterized protein n=1 Tax=Gigaspora margarita TaxID=4874 RepID=A0A8H3XDX2_GIGMA|nr:hypothetical protein F8M41_003328 [Gigaspora margarita]